MEMKFREEYLKNGGEFCPYCKSEFVEDDRMEFDVGSIEYRMRCMDCNRKWWDHYKLNEIIEEEEKCQAGEQTV